ncbi:hypothetical protein T05_2499 [Trichinella murrelli]|uniref:PiggyBac transposable element-derived protein domain-containing protein n=1 Tax=Trichinella murrelli TaxID=144512 RepID=A0A0V0TIR3_9BILA|nr:hypothetical protein T05_2499 [Trichinella murrelli]
MHLMDLSWKSLMEDKFETGSSRSMTSANYFVAVRQLQKKFDHQNHIMNLQDFASCDKQLAQPFLNPNRNAFMDHYFTSFSTVEYFLEHGLRAVGTVFAHRRDVPACLRKTARH